jgi:predicted DNA-binding ribbon-helix-helix protein
MMTADRSEGLARVQLRLDAPTRTKLGRLARHRGCSVATLIEELAASAERQVTADLTGETLTRYYDGDQVQQ